MGRGYLWRYDTLTPVHKLDCESAAADCRFIIQSENEDEAIEVAQNHMREVHGQEYSTEQLRSRHLKIV